MRKDQPPAAETVRQGIATPVVVSLDEYLALQQTLDERQKELDETKDQLNALSLRYAEVQKTAHIGVWELNMCTYVSYWTDSAYKLLGLAPGSVEPSLEAFLDRVHPDDLKEVNNTIQAGYTALKPFSFFNRILWPDGTIRNIFTNTFFEFDKQGKPLRLVGINQDITQLARKEQQIKAAMHDLETFVYRTSHDFRGPLMSILGLVNLACEDTNDEKALFYFQSIKYMTSKLDTTLSALVKVMEIHNRPLEYGIISMAALLDEVMTALKRTPGYDKIKFSINNRFTYNPISDWKCLYHILYCLTENAILFHNFDTPGPRVNLEVFSDEKNNMVLELSDNGSGISDKAKERIFDMFYKGSVQGEGAGLGLYFVKNIVSKLNGEIKLISREHVGSIFKVTLPMPAAV